ncbi:peptidoglycan D,D-transpeptidase FtsI family protein [Clostridium hydrogenum]|nr:penicillin-binding transpeptidase domain-containing protein [Clostridium hydrogenum]
MRGKNNKIILGKKLLFIFSILVALFIFLAGRLFYLMFIDSNWLRQKVAAQNTLDITIPAKRGDILDRNGDKLATSVDAYRIDVDMNTLTSYLKNKMTKEELANKLSPILKMSSAKILKILYPTSDDGVQVKYVTLARQIDKTESDAVKALKVDGLVISSDTKRQYVNNNFLANVLGYTNLENNGVAGVELSYNKELSGIPGREKLETDAAKNQLPYNDSINVSPINGKNVVLTIDRNIQLYAEQAAEEALSKYSAKAVTITVMDPKTGEVLAMVNKPDYDPNNPHTEPSNTKIPIYQLWQNSAVQTTFEPGSIFKVITAYTGLATGTVTDPNAYAFECNGSTKVDGTPINCWKLDGHGAENFIDIIKNSCNVGFVELGLKIGKPNLLKFIDMFGFGHKTGIDLPGEASGIVNPANKIHNVELANMAFGQGIGVTAVQYMSAFNAVANGGTWIRPHVMKQITHNDGGKTVVDKNYDNFGKKTILDSNLSSQLRTYLRHVVSDKGAVGYAAEIPGLNIAGKTGTAQIPDPKTGGYNHSNYIASFAGMAPMDDPKITVLVSITDPNTANDSYYASSTAAPTAKELFQNIFTYLAQEGKFTWPTQGSQGTQP